MICNAVNHRNASHSPVGSRSTKSKANTVTHRCLIIIRFTPRARHLPPTTNSHHVASVAVSISRRMLLFLYCGDNDTYLSRQSTKVMCSVLSLNGFFIDRIHIESNKEYVCQLHLHGWLLTVLVVSDFTVDSIIWGCCFYSSYSIENHTCVRVLNPQLGAYTKTADFQQNKTIVFSSHFINLLQMHE